MIAALSPVANPAPLMTEARERRGGRGFSSRDRTPMPRPGARRGSSDDPVILYGWHTVAAALANPQRRIRRLLPTENAARRLAEEKSSRTAAGDRAADALIDQRLGPDAVHQGLLAEADPLPSPDIETLAAGGHRAGARPDHRSAQCRRDHALGRGVRGQGHRHHGAPQPGGDRRAGEIRLRRAGTGAAGDGAKPCARARPS